MGYLTQMPGLAVQNFVSGAVGIAVAIALVRGFTRSPAGRLGNFWVGLTRITIRVLLPLAFIGGIILLAGGVVDEARAQLAGVALSSQGRCRCMPHDPVLSGPGSTLIPPGGVKLDRSLVRSGRPGLFEFTETILIDAAPLTVWNVLRDLEGWWPWSNPEHDSLERLDDCGIEPGARIRIREKVAGIPGEAVGEITRVDPLLAVTWEAPEAHYRWLGIPLTIGEGVTWALEPRDEDTTSLSAHVWATFPPGIRGRLLERAFTRLLHGVEKDREHARTELRYLKRAIEEDSGQRSRAR